MKKTIRWSLACAVFSGVMVALSASAPAQTQQQIDWCNGKDNAAPDLIIDGCTAIIQSGRFKTDQLSVTFKLRADAFRKKEDPDRAFDDYDQALKLNPKNAPALAERGLLFDNSKHDHARALRDLDAAVEINANYATAWAYRGDVLVSVGKETDAIDSFGRAIKLSPNWMWPANDRGEVYAERGDYQEALVDFDHVVAVAPTSAVGWNNRCRVNAILDRLDQALKDCDEALKIDPKFNNSMTKSGRVSARQHRAFALLKAGRYDEAIENYDLAIQIISNAESLYGRGLAKQKKGDATGAKADIAAAKTLDPDINQTFAKFNVK